ncbi:MAG: hypothetical protein CM15mP84_00640 [Cellvibrionales bacterium]|nr:MAG: hypothetical protein CM15mP84_00640 [Cellvibrionales bacterium]
MRCKQRPATRDDRRILGGSLGKSPAKQFELVKSGVLDIAWILPGYTPGQFPRWDCLNSRSCLIPHWRQPPWLAAYDAGLLTGFDGVGSSGSSAQPPTASSCAAQSTPPRDGRL